MSVHDLGVLDTSVVIAPPPNLADFAAQVAISAVTVGELSFGLHIPDPIKAAEREHRYRSILAAYDPIPYSVEVAHWYGAIAAAVKTSGRNPRSRTTDLMIAATARHARAALLTRNPGDFKGLEHIVTVVPV